MSLKSFFRPKKKQSKFSESIYTLLGFYPKEEVLYKRALIHRSVNRNSNETKNNERLEFLGDSVLDVVIAEWLMKEFTNGQEGTLTKHRASIVNRKNLNLCAKRMGLNQYIKTDGGVDVENTSIPGNCLEALIGAIYLDQGIEQAKLSVSNFILAHVSIDALKTKSVNYKSTLLEWAQKEKVQLSFKVKESIKDNRRQFSAEVIVDEKCVGKGTASNKKEASQKASQAALSALNIQ